MITGVYSLAYERKSRRTFTNLKGSQENLNQHLSTVKTFLNRRTEIRFNQQLQKNNFMLLFIILIFLLAYFIFVVFTLGLHQRLPLALSHISLEDIPRRAAKKYGSKIIFTCDAPCNWKVPALHLKYPISYEWSAERIHLTAGYVAAMLQQVGVNRGDRVAILKKNHFNIHLLILSIIRAGGIAGPINGKFHSSNIQPYMEKIGAKILISDVDTLFRILKEDVGFGSIEKIILVNSKEQVDQNSKIVQPLISSNYPNIEIIWIEEAMKSIVDVAPEIRRTHDEPLYIVHSSGTTGFPKAVVLRNGKQSYAVRGLLCYVHVSRNTDKGYLAVPNNHQAVILTFNSMLLLGFRAHWIQAYDRDDFNAEKVIKELSEGRFTGFFSFPIIYTQLKEIELKNYNLRKMRFWGTTADASHEVIMKHFITVGNAFRTVGLPLTGSVFLDAQGSSEVGTPSVLRYVTRFTKRFERRIGRPHSTPFGPAIRIVTKNGDLAKRGGEAGRLEVKGKTVFDMYWNDPGLTFRSFNDNWFFTGDVARFNNDGHIVQLDREVDVIRTNNGEVYSLLIEEKIHKHPAIFDACVYGEKQNDGSQLPSIAIAVRDGITISNLELKRQLNELLNSNEKLNSCDILSWDQFPIGVTGKTLKRVFRERSEKKCAEAVYNYEKI